MRTISVGTICISITTVIVAFINIYEHNIFAKGKWIEKRILAISLDNKAIIFMNGYPAFF